MGLHDIVNAVNDQLDMWKVLLSKANVLTVSEVEKYKIIAQEVSLKFALLDIINSR